MIFEMPKANTFFKLGLLILISKVFLSFSTIMQISDVFDDILSVIGSLLLFVSIIEVGHKLTTYATLIAILAMGIYSSFQMGNLSMLLSVALCVAACRQDKKETIEFCFKYEAIFLLVHAICAIVTSMFGKENFLYMSGELKYTFGFGHPNTFSIFLINILLMWSWLNFDRLRTKHFLIQMGIAVLNVLFTGTRTALMIVFVFSLLFYCGKSRAGVLTVAVKYMMPIIVAVHLVMDYMYLEQFGFINVIDILLSGRIKLGAYWLEHRGITIFGQNLQNDLATWNERWKLSGAVTIDNLYNLLVLNCGVIWIAILSLFLYRAGSAEDTKNNVFIILWMLYGISEIQGINPIMLFPLFLITDDNNVRRIENG